MFEFQNPLSFFLLILIPLFYILKYLGILKKINVSLTLGDYNGKSRFNFQSSSLKSLSVLSNFFGILAFVFLVVSIANPCRMRREKIFTSRGSDFIFVLDCSPSMAAKDIDNKTRFQAAKEVIENLSFRLHGNSFGLVAMAEEAALLVPPTTDATYFIKRLNLLEIGELGDGTAIGLGISSAVYHLINSTAKQKCIILITDGENNAGSVSPITAAELAKENSLQLAVIGVGTKGSVPIEYIDSTTGKMYSGYLESDFDERKLSLLAQIADGEFFFAQNLNSMEEFLKTFTDQTAENQTYHIKTDVESLYRKYLILSMIFIVCNIFIRRIVLKDLL